MAKQFRGSIVDGARAAAITAERRHQMIAIAAYYRAERRAFRDGDALADWLEAEAEIDHILEQPPLMSEKQEQAVAKQVFQESLETQPREYDFRPEEIADKAQETKRRSRQARKAGRGAR